MGKFLAGMTVIAAILAGAGLYYTQVYAFYVTVVPNGTSDVLLMPHHSDHGEPISYADFSAIDAESSPIRYRACFTTTMSLTELRENYVTYDKPVPLNGPGWFDCYDAPKIGEALNNNTAVAFIGTENIRYGIDRVVAITQDGHGYVWHQLNECGEKAYDGSSVRPDCPTPQQEN